MDSDIPQSQPVRPSFKLHVVMKDRSAEERDEAVKLGSKRLGALRGLLLHRSTNDSFSFPQWTEQINRAMAQAGQNKAIVGVVGNTGAGKTSLINAILGEGQLLPTNCMRACTATITEINYNHSLPDYVAEIEYIDHAEWQQELELGWKILFDKSGKIVRDATSDETDAGVFYAKMKAVYTDLTRDDIQYASVDSLMTHPNMEVLGTVDEIHDDSAASFCARLQTIIDSTDHSEATDSTRKSTGKRRANWPLIRKVKVFVKSAVLSTGVTLVDLPGVQDSNPARAKIATGYLTRCSGLLIATPIHRAVDDKIAKNLLGKSFRRQVMMDGGFSTVTFICTKADDISITEASSSPNVMHKIAQLSNDSAKHQTAIAELAKEVERLQKLKTDAEADLQAAYENQDQLEELRTGNARVPIPNSRAGLSGEINGKRKGDETLSNPHNKRRMMEGQASDGQFKTGTVEGDIVHWKSERKRLQQQKQEITSKLQDAMKQLNEEELGLSTVESRKVSACITERNNYVENALKRDFVAGVKEFDKESIDDDDPTNVDETVFHRDYSKLHNELPVFCVSSKAYQKKIGRLGQEPEIAGFLTEEDTGIPKLQEHCKQLTKAGRVKSADYFFAMLSALINSLSLWITNELNGTVLTDHQRVLFKQILEQELEMLGSKLVHIVADICGELKDRIKSHLYKSFEPAWNKAMNEAVEKTKAWNQLAHQTWRAVCVRNGSFENGNGKYDWNEELVEPILETVAPKWETAFNELADRAFRKFSISCRKAVKEFHRMIPQLLADIGSATPDSHRMLEAQLENYKHSFQSIEDFGKDFIGGQQRMINRAFKPVIREGMTAAYQQCLEETGSGSWKRMKEHMAEHIASSPSMFRDSTKAVQVQIDELIKNVRQQMAEKVQAVHEDICHDYVNTLVGIQGNEVDAQFQKFAEELLTFIDETDREFQDLAAAHSPGMEVERRNDTTGADVMVETDGVSEGEMNFVDEQ